jgi:AcrR family transcriptional regulator
MTAAMALFAERGFDGTSVGEIERAAGLAARSGALYQYFKGGKAELLRSAVEHELQAIDELGSVLDMLPLGDLRAELTLMARWNLASLERRSQLTRFVRRDGTRLPPELRDTLYERLVAQPYGLIVDWLGQRLPASDADLYAIALILVEPMASYRSIRQTFGRVPDGLDDERFVAAWVETALAVARHHGVDAG